MSLDELGLAAQVPGPISARVRTLDGRRVSWLEFDDVDPAAPLSQSMTFTMETAARTALDERIPLVFVINTAGADIREGIAALDGWGRVARALSRCSGTVPTFAIVDGPAVSGPALLLGLMDFTIMTNSGYAFVNGPVMVHQFTGIEITKAELGDAASLERNAGLPIAVVADRAAGQALVEEVLSYLPDHVDGTDAPVAHDGPRRTVVPRGGRTDPRVVDR